MTADQAHHLLIHDLDAISRLVAWSVQWPLKQHEFDTLTLVIFMLGPVAYFQSDIAKAMHFAGPAAAWTELHHLANQQTARRSPPQRGWAAILQRLEGDAYAS